MPRQALVRFLILLGLFVVGAAVLRLTPLKGYLNEHTLMASREWLRQAWWAPLALLLAYVVLCPLGTPASPMMIAGGIVFGAVWGSIYNLLGTFLGGTVTYFLGRALGRDFVVQIGGRKLKRVEREVSRRGFWGLVGVRFLPLPFALVNYCAALAGVRPAAFLATTALGLTVPNVLYTYFTAALLQAAGPERSRVYLHLAVVSVLLAILMFVPPFWMGRKRRQRYEELLARRERRLATSSPQSPL